MSKNVLISGASGFVGTHLTELLLEKGYKVIKLTRSLTGSSDDQVYWNPAKGEIELESLQDLDAVVHLAGENIVGRWTDHKKAKIENSRVLGTKLLSESLAKLNKKPKVSVGAVYKTSINSRVTSPAMPSMLSLLNAESIVGKSPAVPME